MVGQRWSGQSRAKMIRAKSGKLTNGSVRRLHVFALLAYTISVAVQAILAP